MGQFIRESFWDNACCDSVDELKRAASTTLQRVVAKTGFASTWFGLESDELMR
jgi:hypothetical protein